ncbi:MAG: hypothetical protein ACR2MM_09405, partial [Flavobacteriaceae bacterium]
MSNFYRLRRLFSTMWYLRPIQVYYRLYYFLLRKWRRIFPFRAGVMPTPRSSPKWKNHLFNSNSYKKPGTFFFLNSEYRFPDEIDWDYEQLGKLWAYNLNYFEYLNQSDLQPEEGIELIKSYVDTATHKIGDEPYPISLRGINWIKFMVAQEIEEPLIKKRLYRDYQLLSHSLEYHLLGNHLLENGFSLVFAWIYFGENKFEKLATRIGKTKRKEQIFKDGGHFECSTICLLYTFPR